ncbi:MAG: hypothetical protein KDK78_10815, partial [Chlamydiia bacterium]|nr:hypothetical protein [Chlamydiia bacterium]
TSSLPSQASLVRPLHLALTKEKDIRAVLQFEAEPLIPFPIEEAAIGHSIVKIGDEGSHLTILAARKDKFETHLEICRNAGIEPEASTIAGVGLAAINPYLHSGLEERILVYLNSDCAICALVQEDKLVFCVETASNDLGTAIREGNAPPSLQRWLKQAVHSAGKHASGSRELSTLFLGEGALNTSLVEQLSTSLSGPRLSLETTGISGVSASDVLCYAIPIGLALSQAEARNVSTNLRQGNFSYPAPWKRLQVPLSTFTGLCLALALCFYLIGGLLVERRETALQGHFYGLLEALEIDRSTFERDFRTAHGFTTPASDGPLKSSAIAERVQFLSQQMEKRPRSFPLASTVPRVSDVLAWLSSHPKVVSVDPTTGERAALVELTSMNYTMVKRPQKGQVRDRYQVKVDLEVECDSSRLAREFHDALLEPNAF